MYTGMTRASHPPSAKDDAALMPLTYDPRWHKQYVPMLATASAESDSHGPHGIQPDLWPDSQSSADNAAELDNSFGIVGDPEAKALRELEATETADAQLIGSFWFKLGTGRFRGVNSISPLLFLPGQ